MAILNQIWKKWKILAGRIALFQSRLLLTVFYYIAFLLPALFYRFYLWLPKPKKTTTWETKIPVSDFRENLKEQY